MSVKRLLDCTPGEASRYGKAELLQGHCRQRGAHPGM